MALSDRVAMIEAPALQTLLADSTNNLLLVQVSSEQAFQQAHIAGAVLVTPAQLICGEPPAVGRLPNKAALEALFSSLGYQRDMHIVVYDDEGGGWAGRLAWTLDVIGHDGWTYLNGGLHAWHGAGLPLQVGEQAPCAETQVTLEINPQPIAEIADVLAAIEDSNQAIWDVRSAEEYAGLRQSAGRVGHIPGAVNSDWLLLMDPANQYRVIADLSNKIEALGLNTKSSIITHCQTHHRSGLSYMLGRLLGLPMRAYHGSWSEWGNRDDTPIELPA